MITGEDPAVAKVAAPDFGLGQIADAAIASEVLRAEIEGPAGSGNMGAHPRAHLSSSRPYCEIDGAGSCDSAGCYWRSPGGAPDRFFAFMSVGPVRSAFYPDP